MIEATHLQLNQINDVIHLVERDIIVSPWVFWKAIAKSQTYIKGQLLYSHILN